MRDKSVHACVGHVESTRVANAELGALADSFIARQAPRDFNKGGTLLDTGHAPREPHLHPLAGSTATIPVLRQMHRVREPPDRG